MLRGGARSAWVAAAALALGFMTSGCQGEALDIVPAYPGASPGPWYQVKEGPVTSVKHIYYTGDSYAEVIRFYSDYVGKEPGWEAEPSGELSIWRKNMTSEQALTAAKPIDPTQPGKLIVVMNEGKRITIRAFSSHPDR
jgi:hypothetical protein